MATDPSATSIPISPYIGTPTAAPGHSPPTVSPPDSIPPSGPGSTFRLNTKRLERLRFARGRPDATSYDTVRYETVRFDRSTPESSPIQETFRPRPLISPKTGEVVFPRRGAPTQQKLLSSLPATPNPHEQVPEKDLRPVWVPSVPFRRDKVRIVLTPGVKTRHKKASHIYANTLRAKKLSAGILYARILHVTHLNADYMLAYPPSYDTFSAKTAAMRHVKPEHEAKFGRLWAAPGGLFGGDDQNLEADFVFADAAYAERVNCNVLYYDKIKYINCKKRKRVDDDAYAKSTRGSVLAKNLTKGVGYRPISDAALNTLTSKALSKRIARAQALIARLEEGFGSSEATTSTGYVAVTLPSFDDESVLQNRTEELEASAGESKEGNEATTEKTAWRYEKDGELQAKERHDGHHTVIHELTESHPKNTTQCSSTTASKKLKRRYRLRRSK